MMANGITGKALLKGIFFILLMFSMENLCFSQSKKEKKMYLQARDTTVANYVIFKTGERKEIKTFKFGKHSLLDPAKNITIEFTDNTKTKYPIIEIKEIQNEDALYKLATFKQMTSVDFFEGELFAARRTIATLNIYQLVLHAIPAFEKSIHYQDIYFIEKANNGELIEITRAPESVDRIESLVKKSSSALAIIAKIRKAYGKYRDIDFSQDHQLEAVEIFNKDAAEGKLTE